MKTFIILLLLLPLFCKAQRDTVKCIMQVSDTLSYSWLVYMIDGYKVQERSTTNLLGRIGEIPIIYLDDKKNPLAKNIVVWQAKEKK